MKAVAVFVTGACLVIHANSLEAKWTPNSRDEEPLPLSSAYRDALSKLEQTILNSPNPDGTKAAIAAKQGVTIEKLDSLFRQNKHGSDGVVFSSSLISSFSVVLSSILKSSLAFLSIFLKAVAYPLNKAFSRPKRLCLLILFVAVPAYLLLAHQSSLNFFPSARSKKYLSKRRSDVSPIISKHKTLEYDRVYSATFPLSSSTSSPLGTASARKKHKKVKEVDELSNAGLRRRGERNRKGSGSFKPSSNTMKQYHKR